MLCGKENSVLFAQIWLDFDVSICKQCRNWLNYDKWDWLLNCGHIPCLSSGFMTTDEQKEVLQHWSYGCGTNRKIYYRCVLPVVIQSDAGFSLSSTVLVLSFWTTFDALTENFYVSPSFMNVNCSALHFGPLIESVFKASLL